MRNRLLRSLTFSVVWLALAPARSSAQVTAQKVMEDYLKASGGAKALAQVRTETLAGSLTEESTGKTGSWSLITKAPNRLYSETIVGTERWAEAYNGMSAWGEQAGGGPQTLTGRAAAEAEAWALLGNNRFTDLKAAKVTLQLLGTEPVNGGNAWRLQARLGTNVTREVFVDSATHRIVRETAPGLAHQFDYDDYRTVSGVQIPFRIAVRQGAHVYKIRVTRAEINLPVEDAVFDFPRSARTPMPDMKTLMLDVTKNQKAIEELQKQYTCHLTTEIQKGAAWEIREWEIFNIAGVEVRHLIGKEGKPLAGTEKKKADDRFSVIYEKQMKEAAALAANPRKQQKQEEKDEAAISDFLRADRFSNPRRERFRGQEVIAVDYGLNPDYKPRKVNESIAQKLAGVMWIDEHAHDVARLEAHFSESFKVAGGFMGALDKGSNFLFEQTRLNDEVWLPSYAEVHVSGRVLMVRLKENEIDRYLDCRKFSSESTMTPVED